MIVLGPSFINEKLTAVVGFSISSVRKTIVPQKRFHFLLFLLSRLDISNQFSGRDCLRLYDTKKSCDRPELLSGPTPRGAVHLSSSWEKVLLSLELAILRPFTTSALAHSPCLVSHNSVNPCSPFLSFPFPKISLPCHHLDCLPLENRKTTCFYNLPIMNLDWAGSEIFNPSTSPRYLPSAMIISTVMSLYILTLATPPTDQLHNWSQIFSPRPSHALFYARDRILLFSHLYLPRRTACRSYGRILSGPFLHDWDIGNKVLLQRKSQQS